MGVWEVLRNHPDGLGRVPEVISGTSAGALNGALIAAGLTPSEMLSFWLGLAERPPVKANRELFRSLGNGLVKILAREPFRSPKRRHRSARMITSILRKHARPLRGAGLAGVLEYLLTARFDNVSELLDSIKTSYLFSTEPLRQHLADAIGGLYIANPTCRLAINTVDVRTGQVVRFVTDRPAKHKEADATHYRVGPITVDMILASASIPLLFNAVRVGPMELWDGGLLVNTPIAPTIALGAERILPVLVTSGGTGAPVRLSSLGVAVERLADAFLENAYNTDRKLMLERNRLAAAVPERNLRVVELYEAIRPETGRVFNAGSYLFFEPEALRRMYEAGRIAARDWLASGPPLDTHPGPHVEGEVVRRAPLR